MSLAHSSINLPFYNRDWRRWMTPGAAVWGFVLLGVILRLFGFLLRQPLWVDECMLAENYLDRGYLDLLRPLENYQVAPVGFRWIELTVVKLFGYSEWSLRLFPLICGIGSLFLFRHLAERVLSGAALVLAVGSLAVAKAPVGLSFDAKPYSCDLAVSLLLLIFAVEWLKNRNQIRWLWGLSVAIPLALFLSFPAVFVAGGVAAGIMIPVFRTAQQTRNRRFLLTWGGMGVILLVTFGGLLKLHSGPGFDSTRHFMVACWNNAGGFPPVDDFSKFVSWFVDAHFGEKIFSIPYGAENGGGALCCLVTLIGAVQLLRRRERSLLGIMAVVFALAFIAALLQRYPYAGHARLVQFLVPAICLCAGLGAREIANWVHARRPQRLTVALALGLAIFGVARAVREGAQPWHFHLDEEHRTIARDVWRSDDHWNTICALTDLGLRFSPNPWSAYYRCNQRIYSPEHQHPRRLSIEEITQWDRPFQLVVYHPPGDDFEVERLEAFLGQFEGRFKLLENCWRSPPRKADGFDQYGKYEIFRFTPREEWARRD